MHLKANWMIREGTEMVIFKLSDNIRTAFCPVRSSLLKKFRNQDG